MSQEQPAETPESFDEDGAPADNGFAEAFAERAANPAGDRKAAEDEALASSNEPAEQAGSEQAPADAAAGEREADPEAAAFDPFTGMTPEQKAYWQKREASERSQRGRVSALTKKLDTYLVPTREAAPAKQGEEQAEAGEQGAPDLEARLNASAEEYGDVVGPVAEMVKALKAEVATLTASATRHQVDADAERQTEAYSALEAAHPDFIAIAEDPKFHTAWLSQQPQGVQALANSNDPREVSLALGLYKAEAGLARSQPRDGQGDAGSAAQDDKRARQLDGNRQVTARGAPAATGVPNEFKTAFAHRAKQLESESRRP